MIPGGLKEKLFQRYLAWICRPARIKKYLGSRLPAKREPAPVDRRRIRAAALQLEFKLFKDPFDYADEMKRKAEEAADRGAQLVVFPEYNNLQLLGLLPGSEELEQASGGQGSGTAAAKQNIEEEIWLPDLFRYMSPVVQPLVHALFSSLAGAYSLYIMAGSFMLSDQGAIVNRAFLYGPSGELEASQDKVNLLPREAKWKVKRGSSFSVFETPLGNLGLPVCMDATYFETFRILELAGADLVLLPIADPQEYNFWLALRGIWPRVQESPLYGIKGALVGRVAGFVFTGRAGIFAPLKLTPNRDGVLDEVKPYDREAMAVADLDLEALDRFRSDHPWRDNNPALYRRYFPQIYGT